MSELLRVRLPTYISRDNNYDKCPDCGEYLIPIGLRRDVSDNKDVSEHPLLQCRGCRRLFEKVERND